MKKTVVILACNTHWAPYYTRYRIMLERLNIPYDLILWNREGIDESNEASDLIEFKLSDETNNKKAGKIIKFFKFASFVKKTIKKNHYNKIVFLGTYAGVPAFLSGYLSKNYKNNYWIDVRDLTYENFKPFYKLESKAIKAAHTVVLSSKGFENYLPQREYGYIHNIDPTIEEASQLYFKTESDVIRISYIGNISYWKSCKEMIDVLANDNRFLMRFIGPNYEKVASYCNENDIRNVEFHGRFKREDTVKFYNDTDIIYNLYGNDIQNVRLALSNKLYYGMKFGLPILVNENTCMAETVTKYNIGIVFENRKDFGDTLFERYNELDGKSHDFVRAWKEITAEDKEAFDKFTEYIKG